ncbi:MAG: 5-aminolevulinate synthase [Saprospiraceae bacterium]
MSEKDPDISVSSFDFDEFIKSKLDALKSSGSYRHFISIDKQITTFPKFQYINDQGISMQATNWCTNDYLALGSWSGNVDISNETTSKVGTGSGGTRNISGSTIYHRQLEKRIAGWHKTENALLFNSAYQANQTTLCTLGRMIPDLIFISDEENHASMIEGMRATSNKKLIFKHNDVADLEHILKTTIASAPKIIVFESVYSISGTVTPLSAIIELAKRYQCLTYIDEVHAVGLYGNTGAGMLEKFGLERSVDFINGTLSKAIGVFGGYIAASNNWIDFVRSFGSGFIFTTSLPPSICVTAVNSIHEIKTNQVLRNDFFKNIVILRSGLAQFNIHFTGAETHITNILIGNASRCKAIADRLLNEFGIYVQPINQPTVKKGQECLRITITPRHSIADIQHLAKSLNSVLNQKIIITGRSSRLSIAQIEIVKSKINVHFPNLEIEVKLKDSKGDRLINIPLHTQEGIDFFTEDIFNDLDQGVADIAVHSLKDMSTEHFFGDHTFAVVDRAEVRDIVIFNSNIIDNIKENKTIRIGTCSFRRELMALDFLKKALPQLSSDIKLEAVPIRGNIETRLSKLKTGEYDGIILAFAGIDRMFKNNENATLITGLLHDKKIMVLPLIDCLPAPCQGAIVTECLKSNLFANEVLATIKDVKNHEQCVAEKRIANNYGSGCIQKFGVSSITLNQQETILAKGIDQYGNEFEDWYGLELNLDHVHPDHIISSDQLGFTSIKTYSSPGKIVGASNSYFISHISAVNEIAPESFINHRVWAAGTTTWYKLAQLGIWVEGCADSMGFKSIHSLFQTELMSINPDEMKILTSESSAMKWANEGFQTVSTYDIQYQSSLIDKYKLTSSKLIFWNCFAHYDSVKALLPEEIIHVCLPGKTYDQLKELGINPIVFPTFDAFTKWKKKYTLQYIAA